MSKEGEKRGLLPWLAFAVVAALVASFALLVLRAQELPSGVVPVLWDKEACAGCRMHVGEPGFAAQAQLADGTVHNFDDPGCMFLWLRKPPAAVHALYVHHQSEDRWLTPAQTGFITTERSPMGFRLGAVDAGAPDAISFDEAQRRVVAQHGAAR